MLGLLVTVNQTVDEFLGFGIVGAEDHVHQILVPAHNLMPLEVGVEGLTIAERTSTFGPAFLEALEV